MNTVRSSRKRVKRSAYSKAKDDEKVARNWNKAIGLYERGEYSVAILRCATSIELSLNFAIRQELVVDRDLPLSFVDKLLKNANGVRNKYLNIYLPIMEEWEEHKYLKKLWKSHIERINKNRNTIAHSGEFRSRKTAAQIMSSTQEVLEQIMSLYDHDAKLKRFE